EDLLEMAAAADRADVEARGDGCTDHLDAREVGHDGHLRDVALVDDLDGPDAVHVPECGDGGIDGRPAGVGRHVEDGGVLGRDEVVDAAGGDDPSGVHDHDVAARHLDLAQQVGGDDDGATRGGIRLEDRPHRGDLGRVETVRGL